MRFGYRRLSRGSDCDVPKVYASYGPMDRVRATIRWHERISTEDSPTTVRASLPELLPSDLRCRRSLDAYRARACAAWVRGGCFHPGSCNDQSRGARDPSHWREGSYATTDRRTSPPRHRGVRSDRSDT